MKASVLPSLLVVLLISACAGTRDKRTFRHGIIPRDATKRERINQKLLEASTQRGKVIYAQNCAGCHGVDGMGNGEEAKKLKMHPPDLKKLAEEVPDFTFFLSISQWSGQMPGWKDQYTETDREDLVNYIKTFSSI